MGLNDDIRVDGAVLSVTACSCGAPLVIPFGENGPRLCADLSIHGACGG